MKVILYLYENSFTRKINKKLLNILEQHKFNAFDCNEIAFINSCLMGETDSIWKQFPSPMTCKFLYI